MYQETLMYQMYQALKEEKLLVWGANILQSEDQTEIEHFNREFWCMYSVFMQLIEILQGVICSTEEEHLVQHREKGLERYPAQLSAEYESKRNSHWSRD